MIKDNICKPNVIFSGTKGKFSIIDIIEWLFGKILDYSVADRPKDVEGDTQAPVSPFCNP